jgi:hypothetical protein
MRLWFFFFGPSNIISILGNREILGFLTHQRAVCYSLWPCLLQIWSPHIMGNRKISADLKMCALSLWDRGWQAENIVDALLISRASLYRWNAIFEEHGSVNRPYLYLRGRARILTMAVLTAVHTLYESDPDLYLDELVLWLALHHDIIISVTALQKNLQKARLTRKLLHKITVERDEELRQQWKICSRAMISWPTAHSLSVLMKLPRTNALLHDDMGEHSQENGQN